MRYASWDQPFQFQPSGHHTFQQPSLLYDNVICILDGNVIWDDHIVFRMTYLVF